MVSDPARPTRCGGKTNTNWSPLCQRSLHVHVLVLLRRARRRNAFVNHTDTFLHAVAVRHTSTHALDGSGCTPIIPFARNSNFSFGEAGWMHGYNCSSFAGASIGSPLFRHRFLPADDIYISPVGAISHCCCRAFPSLQAAMLRVECCCGSAGMVRQRLSAVWTI